MKRIFAMFLCLSMILSLASIGLPAHAETVEVPQCTCEPAEDGTVTHGSDCALAAQATETKPACDQVATCKGQGCDVEGCTCTAHHEPAVVSDLPENDEPQTVKCDACGAEAADADSLVHNDGCATQIPQTVKCDVCGAEAADEASLVHADTCSKRPADKTEEPPVEVTGLYEKFMACTSLKEIDLLLEEASDEQLATLTAAQVEEIKAHITTFLPQNENPVPPVDQPTVGEPEPPVESEIFHSGEFEIVDYTNVAPFKAPVSGEKVRRFLRNTLRDAESGDGMEISKSATANDDGTYTITLDAYATGSKFITEVTQDVPTDIVLVLDQSGSMKDDFKSVTTTYESYGQRTNSANYNNRHNGNNRNGNLWYKLENGDYVSVSVTRTQKSSGEPTYTVVDAGQNNSYYYNNQNNLYQKVGDQYLKVTVKQEYKRFGFGDWDYTYTYTLPDGQGSVVSDRSNTSPSFGDRGPLYLYAAAPTVNEYTYSYTLNGNTVTIGTASEGDNTVFEQEFFRQTSVAGGNTTRLNALVGALNTFVNDVNAKAAGKDGTIGTEDDVNHRVAVVGFASGNKWNGNNYNYGNTEVFVGANQYRYGTSAQGVYGSAFQSMNTAAGQANVNASIGALTADGGTLTDLGLEMANGILNANPVPAGEKRNRVVIVFTDGQPGWSGYDSTVAGSAITQANTIKNGGASVYSVGIFDGANAGTAGNANGNNTEKSNWFMQNVSSNNGVVQNPSYYLSASDAGALNDIFQQIADNIEQGGSSTTLNGDAVIKDIISDQFKLPDGANKNDIHLFTADYTGENQWADRVDFNGTVVVNGSDVSVSGFDYSANWCGTEDNNGNTTYRGKKLIIEFNVVAKPGFLGGNDVFTNEGAYLYENAEAQAPLKEFNKPIVNVPNGQITVTAQEKNVYLLDNLTTADLQNGATASVGGISLNLAPDAVNYGLEAWQNEYVDITVRYLDADGNAVTDLAALKDDTIYQVAVTVAPKTEATTNNGTAATQKVGEGSATINVFKPELTYKDSQLNVGETPNYATQNYVKVEWFHGVEANKKKDTEVSMVNDADAPELGLVYTPADDTPVTTESHVNVTVKIGETDITDHVLAFLHETCDFKGCTWDKEHEEKTCDCEFIVHIKSMNLTIVKQGWNPIDENQSFVFTVSDGKGFSMDVVIHGNGSVTIKDLPAADYTVTEDTNWSWRYLPKTKDIKIAGSGDVDENGNATVTFTNGRPIDKWLNGSSFADNRWIDKVAHQSPKIEATN